MAMKRPDTGVVSDDTDNGPGAAGNSDLAVHIHQNQKPVSALGGRRVTYRVALGRVRGSHVGSGVGGGAECAGATSEDVEGISVEMVRMVDERVQVVDLQRGLIGFPGCEDESDVRQYHRRQSR